MARIELWRPRRTSLGRASSGWGLFDELARMQREMDDLFDRMTGEPGEMGAGTGVGRVFAPALDVLDCGTEVLVRADLPGLEQKDISVELQDGTLTVRGERKDEHQGHDDTYHWTERWEGRFVRTIPLPSGVKADQINAEFKNGVLEIHIPKNEQSGGKKIAIKGEQGTGSQGTGSQGAGSQGTGSQGPTGPRGRPGQAPA